MHVYIDAEDFYCSTLKQQIHKFKLLSYIKIKKKNQHFQIINGFPHFN